MAIMKKAIDSSKPQNTMQQCPLVDFFIIPMTNNVIYLHVSIYMKNGEEYISHNP